MSTYTTPIEEGQDIYDVAIQEYGDIETIFLLFADNPTLFIDVDLTIGQPITVQELPSEEEVPEQTRMNFFRSRQLRILNNKIPLFDPTIYRDHDGDHDTDYN